MIDKNNNVIKDTKIKRIIQYSEDNKQINILDQRFYRRNNKYYPIVHPVYGAKNCNGAGSDAVAATTIVYSIAPASSNVLTLLLLFKTRILLLFLINDVTILVERIVFIFQ